MVIPGTVLALLAAATLIFGFLVGRLSAASARKADIDRATKAACERARNEGRQEGIKELERAQAELSETLGEQLYNMRQSIIHSVRTYESTIVALEEKLPASPELLREKIRAENVRQLSLELEDEKSNKEEAAEGESPEETNTEGDQLSSEEPLSMEKSAANADSAARASFAR